MSRVMPFCQVSFVSDVPWLCFVCPLLRFHASSCIITSCLVGECFWDPLYILNGAPDSMKRNMQEREILNGRAAMIAVAAFIFEETMTHKPIVSLPTNALLFEPLYQVPFIQEWLDLQFGNIDYTQYLEI